VIRVANDSRDEHASPFTPGVQAALNGTSEQRPVTIERSSGQSTDVTAADKMCLLRSATLERDSQMTIVCDGICRKLLGHASSTYTVAPAADGSRMVLKLALRAAGCSALSTGRRCRGGLRRQR